MKRVVITGIGCITPYSDNVEENWQSILNGKSWIKKNTKCDVSNFKSKVCSQVNLTEEIVDKYKDFISLKDKRRLDDTEYVALIAGYNASIDCNLSSISNEDKEKIGTFIASGVGGIKTIQETAKNFFTKETTKISPFFLPASLTNMCCGNLAMRLGIKGASMSHVSACASSTHSIGEAYNYIKSGKMIGCFAGGTEMAICELGVGGFDAMHALSTKYNEEPAKASRALDKDRDGFVMGEGSVILMIEELEHAKNRKANIYCEIVGYGASCDAYHITSPDPEGKGAIIAMKNALEDANITANKIDYINLHGTSTPIGDIAEINAIKKLFKEDINKVAISSTKSITGHLLGATGALEAMFCCKTLKEGIVPPSINIYNLDENCAGLKIIQKASKSDIKYALSNSFGFGGTNGCLIFKKYEE